MLQEQRLNGKGERYIVGPTGAALTLADLPPANTQRWVIRRKAEVVAAVRGGLLTREEARERYGFHQFRVQREQHENDERLAEKAQAKLADLAQHSRHTDPSVLEAKRAVVEAALARARAKREAGP